MSEDHCSFLNKHLVLVALPPHTSCTGERLPCTCCPLTSPCAHLLRQHTDAFASLEFLALNYDSLGMFSKAHGSQNASSAEDGSSQQRIRSKQTPLKKKKKRKKKRTVWFIFKKTHTHTHTGKTNRASTTQSPNQTVKNKRTDQPARNVSNTLGLLRRSFLRRDQSAVWLPFCSLLGTD